MKKHSKYRFIVLFWLFLGMQPAYAQNLIQKLINTAIANRQTELTILPGTYDLDLAKGAPAHICLKNVNNFKINAVGVKLLCKERATAIAVINCNQVTINGFEIDYKPMLYTQGTIIGFANDWSYCDIMIHAGYPVEEIDRSKVEVHDAGSDLLKASVETLYNKRVEKISDHVFRVYGVSAFKSNVKEGDKIVLYYPAKMPHGIYLENCVHTGIRQTVIYQAPGFAICEYQCSSMYYNKVKIAPGPVPAGGTETRLSSADDDGIHSISAKIGPSITNCIIKNNGDDGIAIHGNACFTVSCNRNELTVLLKGNNDIIPGDTIINVNKDGSVNFTAKVTATREVSEPDKISYAANRDKIIGNVFNPAAFVKYQVYVLDRNVANADGSIVFSPNRQGNGFKVTNNKISNKRARGILIKSSDGLIADNDITHVQMAAILLSPEYTWMESGNSGNVIIRNNTINDCGFDPANGEANQTGIVSVTSPPATGSIAPGIIHKNIRITGNRFNNCVGINILVTSASGVKITGNSFKNVNQDKAKGNQNSETVKNALIVTRNSQHVVIKRNKT